mmetsp:Transcript_27929/g.39455  ORF Transcript_27929/g.39455 Transcript_27929/m.39455 type:complete len:241 (+) Transcript_27929:2-724(+)
MCAEKCAAQFNISREQQDHYTTETYRRAQHAVDNNFFQEIVPVSVKQRQRGGGDDTLTTITKDEEPHSLNLHKLATLKPAFDRNNGTVTAANASSLNDGASAMVIMTQDQANDMGITPLAKILGFADAETAPLDFTIAPSLAVPIALDNAGVTAQDVDYHEINEAFSVVALANMQLLGLDHSNVNVFGGAVALGHPIGMSGARIIGTLYSVLKHRDATVGCASICNGGGGASAIVIERLS